MCMYVYMCVYIHKCIFFSLFFFTGNVHIGEKILQKIMAFCGVVLKMEKLLEIRSMATKIEEQEQGGQIERISKNRAPQPFSG